MRLHECVKNDAELQQQLSKGTIVFIIGLKKEGYWI